MRIWIEDADRQLELEGTEELNSTSVGWDVEPAVGGGGAGVKARAPIIFNTAHGVFENIVALNSHNLYMYDSSRVSLVARLLGSRKGWAPKQRAACSRVSPVYRILEYSVLGPLGGSPSPGPAGAFFFHMSRKSIAQKDTDTDTDSRQSNRERERNMFDIGT